MPGLRLSVAWQVSHEAKAVNLLLTLLILAAILTSILIIGFLVLWWKGVEVIVLPGLGVIIATPLIVGLLLVIEIVIVLLASFAK